jgi:hypothetical protein
VTKQLLSRSPRRCLLSWLGRWGADLRCIGILGGRKAKSLRKLVGASKKYIFGNELICPLANVQKPDTAFWAARTVDTAQTHIYLGTTITHSARKKPVSRKVQALLLIIKLCCLKKSNTRFYPLKAKVIHGQFTWDKIILV